MNGPEERTKIEIPLNVIKEKVLMSLPCEARIEDESIFAISYALNHFLGVLAKKIPIDSGEDKKILIKDIKTCIESEKQFCFFQ